MLHRESEDTDQGGEEEHASVMLGLKKTESGTSGAMLVEEKKMHFTIDESFGNGTTGDTEALVLS